MDSFDYIVVGAGSARSRAPWLALAIPLDWVDRVVFETPAELLGELAQDGRALVAFRGRAEFEWDGLRRVWQAGAPEEKDEEHGGQRAHGRVVARSASQFQRDGPGADLPGLTCRRLRPHRMRSSMTSSLLAE